MTSDPIARYQSKQGAKFDRKNRLRLMTSGEMLDTALRINQRLGWTFLRLTVAPALFCLASVGFVQNFVLPGLFTTKSNGAAIDVMRDVATSLAMAVFVGGPLFLLGMSYSSAIIVHLTSDYMVGKTPDPEEAQAAARRVLPRMFLVNMRELALSVSGIVVSTIVMGIGGYVAKGSSADDSSAGVIAAVGMVGFALGIGIFLYVVAMHALAVPIAVLENARAKIAARRSNQLLKRFGYHAAGTNTIFSLYVLLTFLAGVMGFGMYIFGEALAIPERLNSVLGSLPGAPLFIRAFELVPSFVVIWTLTPIWAAVITIVYYERKIRLEGYDIDALASEIKQGTPAYRLSA